MDHLFEGGDNIPQTFQTTRQAIRNKTGLQPVSRSVEQKVKKNTKRVSCYFVFKRYCHFVRLRFDTK